MGDGVGKIQAEGSVVGDQHILFCYHETRGFHLQDPFVAFPKVENRFPSSFAKHFNLIAHHAEAAPKVNILEDIGDDIIGAVRPHTRILRPLVGIVDQHLIFVTA